MNLVRRISGHLTLGVLSPLLVSGVLLLGGAQLAFTHETDIRLLRTATSLQAQLAAYGEQTQQAALLIGDNSQFAQWVEYGDPDGIKRHLKELGMDGYRFLFLDPRGRAVCEYPKSSLDRQNAGKLASQPAGKLAIMRQGEAIAMFAARPLRQAGVRKGTVVAGLTLNERLNELKNLMGLETAMYINGKCVGATFGAPRAVNMDKLPYGKATGYRHYRAAYFPLLSFNGRSFGALMVAQNIRFQALGFQLFTCLVLMVGMMALAVLLLRQKPVPVPRPKPEPPVPIEDHDRDVKDVEDWSLMRVALGSMSKKIALSSTRLNQNSQSTQRFLEGLSRSTYEIARGSSKQARELGEATLAFEAIAQSINELSDHSGEWFVGIHGILQVAQNGDAAVTKAERILHEAREVARKAAQSIAALDSVGTQLLEMANHIEGFARKSNFLAINTGIEVSRSEHRGMAVLLGEIKKLADESASASQQITGMVRKAYQSVPEAASDLSRLLEVMEASLDLIRTGRMAIHRASLAAEEYEGAIRQTATETISLVERGHEAVSTLERLRLAATGVAEEAEAMAHSLQNKDEGGGTIAGGAAHLSQLAEQLSHIVEKNDV